MAAFKGASAQCCEADPLDRPSTARPCDPVVGPARFRARQQSAPRCLDCGNEVPHLKRRCLRCSKRKETLAAKRRAYREANREANKETMAAKRRAYYEANKETLAAYQRAYYEANKETLAAKRRAYRERARRSA